MDIPLKRVLTGILDNLPENHVHVVHVDLHHQLLVGILHNILHTWHLIHLPTALAGHIKDLGEVGQLRIDFYHPRIEARQEENVVDQFQQHLRVVFDLFDEDALVVGRMLHLEQLSESHDRIQRCTDLVTHIPEEGVLNHFHLLSLGRLLGQFLLGLHHLAHITAHAEIVFGQTVVVDDWHQVQLQA